MVAAKAGIEKAGGESFTSRQGRMLEEGFSFSGYERDGLYLNLGNKKYENISGVSGLDSITDGRGAVYADFDNDGDTDIFLTTIQGRAHLLFRNNIGMDNNFIRLTLTGTKSGKDAFGTVVRVKTSAGILTKIKSGGGGYLSQHDPRLIFGLGSDQQAEWVEVTWSSGLKQTFERLQAGSSIKITEGAVRVQIQEESRFSLPEPKSVEELRLQSLKIKKGARFPNIALNDLNGQRTSMDQVLTGDSKVLINLWATWCVPCAREMPELQKRYAAESLKVVGLSLDEPDSHGKVRKYLRKHGIQYPNFMQGETVVERIYSGDEVFIPLSFLVDESGDVVEIFSGWSEKVRTRLEALEH